MIAPYHVRSDITGKQIAQLLRYTAEDPEIHANTADWRTKEGKPGRFSSHEAFTSWLAAGKTIYTLSDKEQNLSGTIWFTHKEIDPTKYQLTQDIQTKYQTTLGIRLYGESRGRKLAKPFLLTAIDKYQELKGAEELDLWLEVHNDNPRAIHLYESVGLRKIGSSQDGTQDLLVAELSGKLSAYGGHK